MLPRARSRRRAGSPAPAPQPEARPRALRLPRSRTSDHPRRARGQEAAAPEDSATHPRSASLPALVVALALTILGPTPARAQSAWNSVHLSWTAPGDDSLSGRAAQYDLRYSTSAITAASFATATRVGGVPTPGLPGAAEGFTVTGLQPATTYWFAIEAADDAGNWSRLSNVVSKTTAAAPDTVRPAPAAIAVTALTDSTATLTWTAVGDDSLAGTAAAYEIRVSTAPITAASFASATVVPAPAPAAPGTSQSVVVRGLARQATYWFALRTVDEAGNRSALSNVPSATTPDGVPPASIRNLAASFVWISWGAAPGPRP